MRGLFQPYMMNRKTVTAQRRHCQRMVISGLISQTYLLVQLEDDFDTE